MGHGVTNHHRYAPLIGENDHCRLSTFWPTLVHSIYMLSLLPYYSPQPNSDSTTARRRTSIPNFLTLFKQHYWIKAARFSYHTTMSNDLSILPFELRLEIYRHLFTTSMAAGNFVGIGGLLFSCREIYDEVTADCVSKVRPLLEAMRKWAAAYPDGAPLRIEFPCDYSFIAPPSEGIISLPVSSSWKRKEYYTKNKPLFSASVRALHPIFAMYGRTSLCASTTQCGTWMKLAIVVIRIVQSPNFSSILRSSTLWCATA
jgi:hypothetical protein